MRVFFQCLEAILSLVLSLCSLSHHGCLLLQNEQKKRSLSLLKSLTLCKGCNLGSFRFWWTQNQLIWGLHFHHINNDRSETHYRPSPTPCRGKDSTKHIHYRAVTRGWLRIGPSYHWPRWQVVASAVAVLFPTLLKSISCIRKKNIFIFCPLYKADSYGFSWLFFFLISFSYRDIQVFESYITSSFTIVKV